MRTFWTTGCTEPYKRLTISFTRRQEAWRRRSSKFGWAADDAGRYSKNDNIRYGLATNKAQAEAIVQEYLKGKEVEK